MMNDLVSKLIQQVSLSAYLARGKTCRLLKVLLQSQLLLSGCLRTLTSSHLCYLAVPPGLGTSESHFPRVMQPVPLSVLTYPGFFQPPWTPISEKPQSRSLPHCPFRYKGRRPESHAPHVPNQPSEAAAHFYFELAKTVLIKAGGNSSTSIFTHPSSSGGHQGPHRNLHLCAFEIGLYALGLHNFVSPNWLSRTYSSHVSWITGKSSIF